jgi:hypothetical protein
MMIANQVVSITALVHYFEDGKEKYDIVPFKVFQNEGTFITIPLVADELRNKMLLPEQLKFRFTNNRIVVLSEGTHDVLANIVKELQLLHML